MEKSLDFKYNYFNKKGFKMDMEIEDIEITRDNLVNNLNIRLEKIEKLWDISDKDWKKMPNENKGLIYKQNYELNKEISNFIISTFNLNDFTISKFGALESEKLDLYISVSNKNIEIERGNFKTQEYEYYLIEFNAKKFEKNLFDVFDNISWYKNNSGIRK